LNDLGSFQFRTFESSLCDAPWSIGGWGIPLR
jgi:hypothetical protein